MDDIAIRVSAYERTSLGYVYVGNKTKTLGGLKITPGMVKKLDRRVTIPAKLCKNLVSGDYRLEVTVFSGAAQVGSFTANVTIK